MKKLFIFGIPLLLFIVVDILIISEKITDVVGCREASIFQGMCVGGALFFFVYPAIIIIPAIITSIVIKENRLKNFFLTLGFGLIINVVFIFAFNLYTESRNQNEMEKYYQENPEERRYDTSNIKEFPVGATIYPGEKIYYKNNDCDEAGNCNDETYQKDCAWRGGEYNKCGSSCAPGAEQCAAVCAFTCEFK